MSGFRRWGHARGGCQRPRMRHPCTMHTRSHSAWLYASILCLCTSSLACSKAAPEQNSSHSRAAAEKAEAEAKSKSAATPEKEAAAGDQNAARGVLIDHEVKDIEGKTVKLSDFRNKALGCQGAVRPVHLQSGSTSQSLGLVIPEAEQIGKIM